MAYSLLLSLLFQGAYFGIFSGAIMTTWVFVGSVLYPPNKYPGLRSVQECDFFTANTTFINGTLSNSSAAFFKKNNINQDGFINNPYKGHR